MSKNTGRKPNIIFVLSVDTEEEWDWDGPFPAQNCAVTNVQKLPGFHEFCTQLGIRPTYFVDYAVLSDALGVEVLQDVIRKGNGEIGGHLHPWCNPPIMGETREAESHVVNLPIGLVEEKLKHLNGKLLSELGVQPNAFRTGRWGINGDILRLLSDHGYNIDSSVYPYYSNDSFTCEGAPVIPYWPDLEDPLKESRQRDIFEIPVTAGYNRVCYSLWNAVHRILSKPPFSKIHMIGVLWKLNWLRKIYLSPELTSEQDMLSLVNTAVKRGHPVIHMYLHSSSLMPKVNSFVNSNAGEQGLYDRIKKTFQHLQSIANVDCCTISEAKTRLTSNQ